MHCAVISKNILARDRSRFFDQAGHQTTNASIGSIPNWEDFTAYEFGLGSLIFS